MKRRSAWEKDPNEVLDFTIEFDDQLELDSDTNDSATVTVTPAPADGGVTIDANGNDDTTVTVWVSGGTLGVQSKVTATVVTVGGRTYERSIQLSLIDK